MLNKILKNPCVLGAAGKMGRGISLLILQEVARIEAEETGEMGSGNYRLWLVDENLSGIDALKDYLRVNLTKYAEKNINQLRQFFLLNAKLVSNKEIIDYFVIHALEMVNYSTDSSKITASAVFEAIVEDVDIKCKILKSIALNNTHETVFFSNTSSIPIHILNEKAELGHRIVGFHFYNPPAVQKLVELIIPPQTPPFFVDVVHELTKRLQKNSVLSNDIAGFIGNGYFIREILFACERVHELSRMCSLREAIYMINRVTQDFLIRPMGIFQLMDYVGIDVCQRICQIMNTYLPGEFFQDPLIDQLVEEEIVGGQTPEGLQRDGFFQYKQQNIAGIYAPVEHIYYPLQGQSWVTQLDKQLGAFSQGHSSWKHMQRDPSSHEKLEPYLHHLMQSKTQGADLAKEFLFNLHAIAKNLVQQGVAQKIEDVDTVLKNGFFHLYGPGLPCLKLETVARE